MTDEQILQEIEAKKQQDLIAEQAAKIAGEQVNQLRDSLVTSLTGKKDGYKDFDELRTDMKQTAEEAAVQAARQVEEKITRQLADEKERQKKAVETAAKNQEEQSKAEWAQMTIEWKEAVADGLAPALSPTLAEKLNAGTTYESLTPEEKKDPGLVFYNQAREAHVEARKNGATSFYRTIANIHKKPAGSKAPVFGGAPMTHEDEDLSYDDLHSQTMSIFNMRH